MTRLAIAATLNHIRRIFVPWLGQYVCGYESPLEDLRLARSNPEVFVAAMLGGTSTTTSWWGWWGWVLFSCGQKGLWDMLGSYLAERLLWLSASGGSSSRNDKKRQAGGAGSSAGCGESRSRSRLEAHGKKRTRKRNKDARTEFYQEMIKTGHLAYALARVEYLFARATNTAAWCIALHKLLLSGGEAEYTALGIALQQNWTRVPLAAWLLGRSLMDVVLPLLREALLYGIRGQPAVLMAVVGVLGGVIGLLKYRSTVYIALEISGLFIFAGPTSITFDRRTLPEAGLPGFRHTAGGGEERIADYIRE
ncbi:uncharacterized protein B0T15DRAFT_511948 [Chaetomium strumarium]|uniref:Uncharacterized protein n=1 Tax=Chaetomium strumarium TaxID=1170767 RepID=A0AAJ0GUB3_9PEZI|nr:hypothetical protein B0T15DRAFT_511948 [Chaetomium strumarium]